MAGGLMRAAATASMVSNARLNKQKRKAVQNYNEQVQAQMQQAPQSTQATPAPQATPAVQSGNSDLTVQLQELATLHSQGILTDEEFAAKKAQVLGI